MTLIQSLAAEFEKELTKIFKREETDKKFMNQTILGCRWRAFWGIVVAIKDSNIIRMLALSIAKHRLLKHGDKKYSTIKALEGKMSDEQIKASDAETRGWNS